MSILSFKVFPKNCLGIDIGTSSVKIVEVSRVGSRIKLENYGELTVLSMYENIFRTFNRNILSLSSFDVAKAIKAIIEEAGIRSKNAAFSIPNFSTFFTNFELPPMSEEELPEAVRFEARQHIPLPLGEVTLDWQIIGRKMLDAKSAKFQILMAAVPNEVIQQYQEIIELTGLKFHFLEAEAFALVRSLIQDEKKLIIIVDIGALNTAISIVDKKILQLSHSIDISGGELTQVLAKSLDINYKEAEKLKMTEGIFPPDKRVAKILSPLVDLIVSETGKVITNYENLEGKEIEEMIITGGSANLPGLKDFFASRFKKNIVIANPFTPLFYPPILEGALKEMGPSFAVAVGIGERGLE